MVGMELPRVTAFDRLWRDPTMSGKPWREPRAWFSE
jgi:hypothetical protein